MCSTPALVIIFLGGIAWIGSHDPESSQPGVYPGVSAQFSGDGFSDMRFNLRALSPQAFKAWQTTIRACTVALNARGYAQLAQPSTPTP